MHSQYISRKIVAGAHRELLHAFKSRGFSSCSPRLGYADTIPNLKIGKHTRVIYQGFTGRVATTNAKDSIEYGTQIVGGVTPNKEGEHLGLPLLPTMKKAKDQLKPDATAIFVAAQFAGAAIEDAIEAEIPLIVSVAEFIPLHDMLRISAMLNTQSKSRLVGANAPGIIAPLGHCRIGFQPLVCYAPGHIGVVAKSGTLSYETVGSLTRAGLGQSLCIGMGGDIVAGTNLVESLTAFEQDEDTEGIVLVGEIGGRAELDAAEWIKDYRKRVKNPKPICATVAGKSAPAGRIMGHAGAFTGLGEIGATEKFKALENAGAIMVNHPAKFGSSMTQALSRAGRNVEKIKQTASSGQRRDYHTARKRIYQRPRINVSSSVANRLLPRQQQRGLHVTGEDAIKMLGLGTEGSADSKTTVPQHFLSVTVDRSARCPTILASPTTEPKEIFQRARSFKYDYLKGPDDATIQSVIEHLQLDAAPPAAMSGAKRIIQGLTKLFKEKEAYTLETYLTDTSDGNISVSQAKFSFDDSAFKSAKRQQDLQIYRKIAEEDQDEYEASKDGIVYIKLSDPEATIGTLINGAGLAMNANDALADYGARSTNFLDTGGKATSETVKKSFELLLRDERVKVIFVNIFGGLTLCDMIAEGVMMAFKDLDMKTPVVVRLRGTNEEKGQQMISESGLPLHAFDDFEEASKKCIELADARR